MTFEEAAEELKEIAAGKFYSLAYDRMYHKGGEIQECCNVYIDGSCYHRDITWQLALERLKREILDNKAIDLSQAPTNDVKGKE